MTKLGLEHRSTDAKPELFPVSRYLEELFTKSLLPPSVDCVCVPVSSGTSVRGGARVCIYIHTYIHTRAPGGIKAPSEQTQEVHWSRKQVQGTAAHSHSALGGPLFAVRINLGLLQRPKLGSHFRSEALTFKKLQSK